MHIFILFITQIVLLATQNKYCNKAYQCVDHAWISSDQNVFGNGYKSLSGPSTLIINNNTYCSSAYSCTETSFILSQFNIYCEGVDSCSNIGGYITASYVACKGSHSCENSTIISNKIDCDGTQSCNYANISSRAVYADGSYSMYGSIIDSNNNTSNTLSVYLTGYQSGFGAKIICRSGDTCTIYCYANGCQMLFIECEDDNNCNINFYSDAWTNDIFPPIQNMTDFDDNLYDTKYIIYYKTDQLCNNPSNQFIYDDYQQQQSAVYMNANNGSGIVCCRGTDSCRYAGTITSTTVNPDILICSGRMSCYQIDINMTGTIFCQGYASCLYKNINGADNVYCSGGPNSCFGGLITRSKNIYCSGAHACAYSRMKSNGVDLNIYLLGRSSGYELDIYCGVGDECDIICGGYHSCVKTILFCNDNCLVYCNTTAVAGCPIGNYTLTHLFYTTIPTNNPTALPTPLATQNKYCNRAYQCVDHAWILSSNQNIFSNGYKSLSGPSTLIMNNNNTYCYSAYSCTETSFILSQSNVYCEGVSSCSNIVGYIDASYVACKGLHSCENSTIISTNYVYCDGTQSCNYANISSRVVYADGSYSMYGSIIDSNNITSNRLSVWLLGYQSGFGAKIICRSGDICTIFCYANGCQMLFVVCEDYTNCNIILNPNNPTAIIPPIQNIADFDDNLYDTKYIIHYNTDKLCDRSNQFIYDDYQQLQSPIYINTNNAPGSGLVCCRGTESCKYAGAIQFAPTTDLDILICSGRMSCYGIDISTAGTIFCEGYASCLRSNINGANNVYCLGGSNSCSFSVISGSKNVYCVGYHSCAYSRIESNGVSLNIYLLGRSSAYESEIYCGVGDECVIMCGGRHSCLKTTLFCNDNCLVYCNDTVVAGCPAGNYTLTQLQSISTTTALPIPTNNPTSLPTSTATLSAKSTATLQPISVQQSINEPSPYNETLIILIVILTVLIVVMLVGIFVALMKMRQNINDALPKPAANNVNINADQNNANNANKNAGQNNDGVDVIYKHDSDSEIYVKYNANPSTKKPTIEMQPINLNPLKSWFDERVAIPNSNDFYYELFIRNGYVSMDIVKLLTEDTLKSIGITQQGHIDKIMSEIDKLRQQNNNNDNESIYGPGAGTNDPPTSKEEKMEEKQINLNPLKPWFQKRVAIPNSNDFYYDLFIRNGYRTMDTVKLLTEDKLKSIGINKQGHIDKIMFEIDKLKQQNNGETQSGFDLDLAENGD